MEIRTARFIVVVVYGDMYDFQIKISIFFPFFVHIFAVVVFCVFSKEHRKPCANAYSFAINICVYCVISITFAQRRFSGL